MKFENSIASLNINHPRYLHVNKTQYYRALFLYRTLFIQQKKE